MKIYCIDSLLRLRVGRLLRFAVAFFLIVGVCAGNDVRDGLRRSPARREGVPAVGRAQVMSSSVPGSRPSPARWSNEAATLEPSFPRPRNLGPELQLPSPVATGTFTGSVGDHVPHVSDVAHKSTQPALAGKTSQGTPANSLVANQFRAMINEGFSSRDSFIKSGDPASIAETKRRNERSHDLLINLIDLGYAPWLVGGWCNDLFADQIVPGMPSDLVEAYWGDPLYIQTSGPEEILTYPYGTLYRQVILVEGQVIEVRTLSSIAES